MSRNLQKTVSRIRRDGGLNVALAVLTLVLAASPSARADVPDIPPADVPEPPAHHQPRWDSAWSHNNAWDYSLAGIGAASIITYEVVLQPVRPPLRWNGPVLFDTAARNALRTSNPDTQRTAEGVAWALWGVQLAYPVFVDVPYAWSRYGRQLAADLFWQDAVTLTIAGAVDLGVRDLAGRSRPGAYDCLQHGGSGCLNDVESTRSFPGGHTTNSTAATVLTCTQHLYTELYGRPWDQLVCATTVASDLTLATLRVISDNHWASDQLAGIAFGALIGWGVPYVMHYHGHTPYRGLDGALIVPMPMTYDHGGGFGVTGLF